MMVTHKLTYQRLIEYLESKGKTIDQILPKPNKNKPLFGFIAIRTSKKFTDGYDDFLLYINGYDLIEVFACTTKAGIYYVYNPITYGGLTGTAVLAPGEYLDTWECHWTYRVGYKSMELLQVKPVIIGRDGNRNDTIDYSNMQEGYFGINIHEGGTFLSKILRWSAGCIAVVSEHYKRFKSLMMIGRRYSLILHEFN